MSALNFRDVMQVILMVIGSLILCVIGTVWFLPAILIIMMFVMDPPWSSNEIPLANWLPLLAFVVVPPLVFLLALVFYIRHSKTEASD